MGHYYALKNTLAEQRPQYDTWELPGAAAVGSCQTVDCGYHFAQLCFYGVKDFMQKILDAKVWAK